MTTVCRNRFPAVFGVVVALLGLGLLPRTAQGQMRSSIASVTLTAYAAPGVRWPGTGPEAARIGGSAATHLGGMTVNTHYRIERWAPNQPRVVLLARGTPGVVPWDRIGVAVGDPGADPVIVDLVVAPTL
jgi:hypothetical protein